MHKLIYITGAPRCGKTTFAALLAKRENVSLLSLDAFSKSIRNIFKDFQMYSGSICIQPDINRDKFLELVYIYCENFFSDYPDSTLIIDGCHFSPEEFSIKFPCAKIVCFGISGSAEKIYRNINKKDWMSVLDEKIKSEYADMIMRYSTERKRNGKKPYMYCETGKTDVKEIYKYLFEGDKNV